MKLWRQFNAFMCSPAPMWVVRLLAGVLAVEVAALFLLLAGGVP